MVVQGLRTIFLMAKSGFKKVYKKETDHGL